MKRLLTLLCVLSLLARGLSVFAQEEGVYELDEVVVTATKTERILTDVPVNQYLEVDEPLLAHDMMPQTVINPATRIIPYVTIIPEVRIKNVGSNSETDIDVECEIRF